MDAVGRQLITGCDLLSRPLFVGNWAAEPLKVVTVVLFFSFLWLKANIDDMHVGRVGIDEGLEGADFNTQTLFHIRQRHLIHLCNVFYNVEFCSM